MAQVRRDDTEVGDFSRNSRSFVRDLSYRNRSDSTAVTFAKAIDEFVAYLRAIRGPVYVVHVTADYIRGWPAQTPRRRQSTRHLWTAVPAPCKRWYRSGSLLH